MPRLTIRHITTYHYGNPVAFGEHSMMLRPRESHDQHLIAAELVINPTPNNIRRTQDAFDNQVDIARFAGRAEELRFASTVRLDHSPFDIHDLMLEESARTFPFIYGAHEMPDLVQFVRRQSPDPEDEVAQWAQTFLLEKRQLDTLEFLANLTCGIKRNFEHLRRDEKGVQPALSTLELGSGSCRDLAVLMIDAVRSLGLAARFVSGYLHVPYEDEAYTDGGNTHGWCQVYLPGPGWVDFDPSSGIVGNRDLIRVAVVREPDQATPLHGTWIGFPSDFLRMNVEVAVTSDAAESEKQNENRQAFRALRLTKSKP
jgi:transglutaminase-like putative cysteine protease